MKVFFLLCTDFIHSTWNLVNGRQKWYAKKAGKLSLKYSTLTALSFNASRFVIYYRERKASNAAAWSLLRGLMPPLLSVIDHQRTLILAISSLAISFIRLASLLLSTSFAHDSSTNLSNTALTFLSLFFADSTIYAMVSSFAQFCLSSFLQLCAVQLLIHVEPAISLSVACGLFTSISATFATFFFLSALAI